MDPITKPVVAQIDDGYETSETFKGITPTRYDGVTVRYRVPLSDAASDFLSEPAPTGAAHAAKVARFALRYLKAWNVAKPATDPKQPPTVVPITEAAVKALPLPVLNWLADTLCQYSVRGPDLSREAADAKN